MRLIHHGYHEFVGLFGTNHALSRRSVVPRPSKLSLRFRGTPSHVEHMEHGARASHDVNAPHKPQQHTAHTRFRMRHRLVRVQWYTYSYTPCAQHSAAHMWGYVCEFDRMGNRRAHAGKSQCGCCGARVRLQITHFNLVCWYIIREYNIYSILAAHARGKHQHTRHAIASHTHTHLSIHSRTVHMQHMPKLLDYI